LFQALIAAQEHALRTRLAVALAAREQHSDTPKRRFAPPCAQRSSSSTPIGPPPSCYSGTLICRTRGSTSD
jgi:hypothetical protein